MPRMKPLPEPLLEQMVELSHAVAARGPLWIQGAGGNISCKDTPARKMWIKATGFRLADVQWDQGVVSLDYQDLSNSLAGDVSESEYANALGKFLIDRGDKFKASMEAGFHARLPRRWVLHFHSCEALLMYHEWKKNPKNFEQWILKTHPSVALLPQLLPGLEITKQLNPSEPKDFYILENHGVILHAGEPTILGLWEKFADQFCRDFFYPRISLLRGKAVENFSHELSTGFFLKVYFPDTAVFYQKLLRLLSPKENGWCPSVPADFFQSERGLFEICVATKWLSEACPKLAQWPADVTAKIANLPTESVRLAQMESNHAGNSGKPHG